MLRYVKYEHRLIPLPEDVDIPIDIEFLYEYNWRIEKCLYPISNDIIINYENITNRYNPFSDIIKSKSEIKPDSHNKLFWSKIKYWWIELQFAILRYYREEGFIEKWQCLSTLLKKLKNELSSEQKARFSYESCLYHLFTLNISNVRKEISNWIIDETLPYWEVKRAGIFVELGHIRESEQILKKSLNTIRKRLYLSPTSTDYSNVSQEAYLLQILQYILDSKGILKSNLNENFPQKNIPSKNENYSILQNTPITKSDPITETESNNDREKRAEKYKKKWDKSKTKCNCDPWAELKSYQVYLDKKTVSSKKREQTFKFDLNYISNSYNFGGPDEYVEKAYSFLRYLEEIGIPYCISRQMTFAHKTILGALRYIENYSQDWAISSYIRLGSPKEIESVFGRKSLSTMNHENADNYIQNYLTILENSKTDIKNGDSYNKSNFAISLSTIIPEVLSKLCTICSSNTKLELLKFLKTTFESEYRDNYKGIKNLTRRLIQSFSNEEILKNIPLLIQFPIIPEPRNASLTEYIEPFKFINSSNLKNTKSIKIDSTQIDHLISLAENKDKRELALVRLIKLWKLKLLSEQQINKTAKILWGSIDEKTGFPKGTNYYNFAFISLPHPKKANPEELLRNYITSNPFPIHAHKKEKGLPMTGGNIRVFTEIEGTTNTDIDFNWKPEDITLLVGRLIEWWDADKKNLLTDDANKFGSTYDEFFGRFSHLNTILSEIISVHINCLSKEEKSNIKRIIGEASEYNLPNINTKAAFCHVFQEFQEEVKSLIFNNLFARSKDKVIDALSACVKLIKSSPQDATDLVRLIAENIRSLLSTDLKGFLNVMTFVVSDHSDLLDDKVLNDLKIGLSNLIPETKIEEEDSDEQVHYKLIYRREAARLTVALSKYYTSKNIEIPTYVSQWKELCLNPNEFAEIRNVWKNAISE